MKVYQELIEKLNPIFKRQSSDTIRAVMHHSVIELLIDKGILTMDEITDKAIVVAERYGCKKK